MFLFVFMAEYFENLPTPKVLINSLRQIGYSFESAVADILDNSLSVYAKNIYISLCINPFDEQYITFLDDGKGMTRNELANAMKIGSNFDGERAKNDLGRFGLGLKTASFSQCRNLVVASKKDGDLSVLGWDIAQVQKDNKWLCQEYNDSEIANIPQIGILKDMQQGTLVVWRDFDLLLSKLDDNKDLYRALQDSIQRTRKHIELIFHRYLDKKVKIFINRDLITPQDPFLERHLKTEKGKQEVISLTDSDGNNHDIKIQSYTLPHYHDLDDDDRVLLGGADTMRDCQGFYIYRNERLIIYGTWFGIRVKSEVAKYAKIKVDIPNSLDDIWDIDIKKQKANIPPKLVVHFRKIIEDIRTRSERKTTHKHKLDTLDNNRIWNKKQSRTGKDIFAINLDCKFVRDFVDNNFEESNHSKIYRLLEIVGQAIPFDDIYSSVCNQNIELNISLERQQMLIDEAKKMINIVANTNKIDISIAVDKVLSIEPFNDVQIVKLVKEALNYE